jgi:mRNA interferase MazF
MQKDFSEWHHLKTVLQTTDAPLFFSEREVWFASIGANIGDEEDGRGVHFWRPVVIFQKFNPTLFWGIPLTSTQRTGPYYYQFNFSGYNATAILSQMRPFDRKRLIRKIGIISIEEFELLHQKIAELVSLQTEPSVLPEGSSEAEARLYHEN